MHFRSLEQAGALTTTCRLYKWGSPQVLALKSTTLFLLFNTAQAQEDAEPSVRSPFGCCHAESEFGRARYPVPISVCDIL